MCSGQAVEQVSAHDSVYFMRVTDGMVPVPMSAEEARDTMPSLFEVGLLNAHTLVMLEQVVTQIYMPLLSYSQQKAGQKSDKSSPHSTPRQAPSREVTEVSFRHSFAYMCSKPIASKFQT